LSKDKIENSALGPVGMYPATDTAVQRLDALQADEIQIAADALAKAHAGARNSWDKANRLVRDFRPVASYLWRIVHAVLGKNEKLGKPDPIAFDAMTPLMRMASGDKTLSGNTSEAASLEESLKRIGLDTAAAVCVMHGVCRRVGHATVERIWRPIIDDALLRAHIGFLVGSKAPQFGKGRGLLAGFCGRAGLAVQIASSDAKVSQRALEGLAAGMDIRVVGLKTFGCDPLQVAAMMLASAGVSTEAAIGVASFSDDGRGVPTKGMQFLWLSTFAIVEYLRIDEPERIEPAYWKALGIDPGHKGEIIAEVSKLQKKGHRWDWICDKQLTLEEDLKTPGS